MTKESKKDKLKITLAAIVFVIIIFSISLISLIQKPYKKYDDNIFLEYYFEVVDGEVVYYLYPEKNYATDGVSVLRIAERNVIIHYRYYDIETRKTTYVEAFKVDMYYDIYNFKVIKLNDVPKRVKNLELNIK